MFSMPSGWEWIIIGAIVFIIFGRRLPGVMKSIGKSFAEFRKGLKGVEKEIKDVKDDIDNVTKFKIG